ncbi:GIY-YIG nuclease family protein [Algoriphagus resistens]|uniref:GIY-YIG nuclease family protein n=1 Tax=Algoriphagus resistens TaxID=1750590 RepID=UPI000A79ED50|nr:GIY-YIG nuclease family protein [Algoriphagus resistens]
MATMYNLQSERLAKYYVGTCIDLDRRLYERNIGHSKFSSTGIPWKLVYLENFDDLINAKRREF